MTTYTERVADTATAVGEGYRIDQAILALLREAPRTDEELTAAYLNLREINGWPWLPHIDAIKVHRRQLSERGIISGTDERRESHCGRPSTVWGTP